MAEKRKFKRFSRRIKVRFGEKVFDRTAVTGDVSATGAYLVSAHLPPLGTRLHLEFTKADTSQVFAEGLVTRRNHVPGELRSVLKSGFGVRFLSGAELLVALVPELKTGSILPMNYDTIEAFKTAWDRELRRGGLMLTSPKNFAVNTVLSVEFSLPFAERRHEYEARVVHAAPAGSQFGLALVFVDAASVIAELGTLVDAPRPSSPPPPPSAPTVPPPPSAPRTP